MNQLTSYKKLKVNNRTVQYKEEHKHYTEYIPFGIQSYFNTSILPIIYGINLTISNTNKTFIGKAVCLLSDQDNQTVYVALSHNIIYSIPITDIYRIVNSESDSLYKITVFIPQLQNSYILKFETFQDKDQFIQGIQYFMIQHVKLNANQQIRFIIYFSRKSLSYYQIKEQDLQRQFGEWFNIDPLNAQLILQNLNLYLSIDYITFIFYRDENVVTLSDILEFYKLLHEFTIVEKYFLKYNSEIIQKSQINLNCQINESGLKQFFTKEMYLDPKNIPLRHKVNYFQFLEYLFSKANFTEIKPSIYQNMDLSFDKYFIFGCKNIFDFSIPKTSLKKIKECKIEEKLVPLYYLIKQGVRYFELEVWDGKEEPQCNCQRTFSTISLREILNFMHDHLFESNEYPVILHIESHCTALQNKYVTVLLDQAFSKRLLQIKRELIQSSELPILSSLKNKVLISCSMVQKQKQNGYEVQSSQMISLTDRNNNVCNNIQYFAYQNDKYQPEIKKQQLEQTKKLLDYENEQMLAYKQIQKFVKNDIQKMSAFYQIKDISSISKWCINCISEDNLEFRQNQDNTMTKVDAPKKLGVNINSFSCVIEKIQIIPLEHHVIDLQYIYLWAMFRANKKCGYIQLQAKEKEYDLIVKLMCGYQLKNKKYCLQGQSQVEIVLLEPKRGIENFQSYTSNKISINTINPYFEEDFRLKVLQPNLSVVLFKVYIDDIQVSWNAITVDSIQQGFRRIDLRDNYLNKLSHSFLMCDIKFLQYI